jgi:hypothetical protein
MDYHTNKKLKLDTPVPPYPDLKENYDIVKELLFEKRDLNIKLRRKLNSSTTQQMASIFREYVFLEKSLSLQNLKILSSTYF